jgi:hypothetical protein
MKLCHLQENGWNKRFISLSKISQTKKDKYQMFSLKCGIQYLKIYNTIVKKQVLFGGGYQKEWEGGSRRSRGG